MKVYPDDEFQAIYIDWTGLVSKELRVKPLSFTQFRGLCPYNVILDAKQMCCVCVYHHGMQLHAKALHNIRKIIHQSRGTGCRCQFHGNCACTCLLCATWISSPTLSNFLNSVMCPREEGARRYNLRCVLGVCEDCGWDRIQGGCEVEGILADREVTVKCLVEHTKVGSGSKRTSFKVEGSKTVPLRSYLTQVMNETSAFLIHDHIMRNQGDLYHHMMDNIPSLARSMQDGCMREVWVADFIENFQCFSKKEMQQEYYNKIGVSIFIVSSLNK